MVELAASRRTNGDGIGGGLAAVITGQRRGPHRATERRTGRVASDRR